MVLFSGIITFELSFMICMKEIREIREINEFDDS
jgi:hypothetical protein